MVYDARGAILNQGALISKAGAEFMKPGTEEHNIEVRGANTEAPRSWIF